MATEPFISMIMCTRNRADALRRVLESAASMDVPDDLVWEFILVDNGSSDHTADVVAEFTERLPIRRVLEPKAGLSNARNRGVREARGTYICWTDDDVVISQNWLLAYRDAFQAYPQAAFFGGKVSPLVDAVLPDWWQENRDLLSTIFAERDFGDEPFQLTGSLETLPFGANFAVRTDVQRRFLYDPQLGVSPDFKRLGEETEVFMSMLDAGHFGVWVPASRVTHIIPASRATLAYVGSYFRSVGETDAYSGNIPETDNIHRRTLGAPNWVWRKMVSFAALFVLTSLWGTSARWLRHYIDYNRYRGAIRYWRTQAAGETS